MDITRTLFLTPMGLVLSSCGYRRLRLCGGWCARAERSVIAIEVDRDLQYVFHIWKVTYEEQTHCPDEQIHYPRTSLLV